MADVIITAAQFVLIILAFLEDAAIENIPQILLVMGALALSIGVIAWPLEPEVTEEGNERGFF